MDYTDLPDKLREVHGLHAFAELFGFDWDNPRSNWTWHDVAVEMADAIEAWGTRYERTCYNIDTINKEWFFCCSECHSVNDDNFYNEWSYCPDCGAKVVN